MFPTRPFRVPLCPYLTAVQILHVNIDGGVDDIDIDLVIGLVDNDGVAVRIFG